jgi:dihydrofolate reductase
MRLIAYPAVSIDGFIADNRGECYSWIDPVDEEDYKKAVRRAGCRIMGRKTYEQYKDEMPKNDDFVTYVYTSSDKYKDQERIKFVSGSLEDVVRGIEGSGFKELIVTGGGELNGGLMSAGLVDEIILSVHPIILGGGIKVFGSYNLDARLKLLATKIRPSGVVVSGYRVV